MADAVAPAAPAGEEQGAGMWGVIRGLMGRMLFIYFITSMFKTFTGGPATTPNANATAPAAARFPPSMNLFKPGQLFDLYMFLDDTDSTFVDFDDVQKIYWIEKGMKYGDWGAGPNKDGNHIFHKTMRTPEPLWRNQSLYLHVFLTKAGHSPNPIASSFIKRETMYNIKQLNKFKKKHYKKTANLLTGQSEQSEEDLKKAEIMSYEIMNFWHPNITISLVDDQTAWTKGQLPSPLDEAVKFDTIGGFYFPIFMFNTYWNLGSEYMPINETVKEINLTVTYQPLTLFKYQLYASQQMRNKWSSMLGGEMFEQEDDDQDSIKQALLETNPILLGVTVAVSLLHTVFEFLAFKNDIQFWRSRKDLSGLSVRSVLFNIFQSLIVFLYICDNDTNFVVKMSVGVGLLIECWKIPKVMDVKLDRENKIAGIIPRITFADKGSYIESDTKIYDQMAFKYLSWALFPLLGGYAIYSIIYVEQRGWYSWVLNMLYGFLLTFGFITMTPQLFINYKLKSVAHLPWRMLTYKFINTFIDDLFAFVIRMPMMYRLGCFRDDIIFLIYLYQRWIYRVDPKRMNEYGISMEDPTGAQAIAEAEAAEAITEQPAIEDTPSTSSKKDTKKKEKEESKKDK